MSLQLIPEQQIDLVQDPFAETHLVQDVEDGRRYLRISGRRGLRCGHEAYLWVRIQLPDEMEPCMALDLAESKRWVDFMEQVLMQEAKQRDCLACEEAAENASER